MNNCLCCSYDPSEKEKINEIISNNNNNIIEKEATMEKQCSPLPKKELLYLFNKEEAVCKIKINKVIKNNLTVLLGTGFFLKINDDEIPFHNCLITNNHIIDENDIKMKKEFKLLGKNIDKLFILSDERKIFTNKDLDYTCIEIFQEDDIKKYFNIDPNIIEKGIKIYEKQDIFILQYPSEELSFSSGKILSVSNKFFIHNSSTVKGSSGSPIVSRNSNCSVIGLHAESYKKDKSKDEYSYNISIPIISIMNDIKHKIKNQEKDNKINDFNKIQELYKPNNYIIAEVYIKEKSKIRIINSFEEETRNKYYSMTYFTINDYRNEKEIKENCEISINDNKINFSYFYILEEIGKNIIKYSFKNKLIKTDFLFSDCSLLSNIDLSKFNSQNVTNMCGMFKNCGSLSQLDLSNFNTQNVTNMAKMYEGCSSLTKLDLSNFNTQNVTNMAEMFKGCSSLLNIDISNFNTENVTNMIGMFYGCSSLSKLDLSHFNTLNVINMCDRCEKYNISNSINSSPHMLYYIEKTSNGMFGYCSSLTNLDISNFNTQNVINMAGMFEGCSSLTKLNLSNFNTRNVTNMIDMFYFIIKIIFI